MGRVLAISVTATGCGSEVRPAWPRSTRASSRAPGGRRFVPLRPAGEPLRGVSGIVETADGELWLNGADGVTRIPAAEVRRALADSGYQVQYERLDYRDGLEPPAQQIRPLPTAAAGTDGRIWFASEGGIAWVDPRRVRRNAVPPPVHLRVLTAGGRRSSPASRRAIPFGSRLAMRTLSMEYTAYSLAVPDRVRFKYRLEGLEDAWQDAGGRRETFFTNLPPGRYRFHVIAANDDGVWNTAGASLAFTIAPAWNQTWRFFAARRLLAVATPALPWSRGSAAAHVSAEARTQARFEAMLAERTRVARELHDTLLGGMAGVAMQLDASAPDVPRRVTAAPRPSSTSSRRSAARPGACLVETRQLVAPCATP